MNTLSSPDDLELGEIPTTTLAELKPESPLKELNPPTAPARPCTPLARLFFQPNHTPTVPVQLPNDSDHRTDSSRSHESEEGRGADRSRSRDRKPESVMAVDEEEEGGSRRRSWRLAKKKKRQEEKTESTVIVEEAMSLPAPAEPLIVLPQQQVSPCLQKLSVKQEKQDTLEIKQSLEGLPCDRPLERASNVKLNNTNFDRFFKTRLCPQFQAGFCERNMRCTYAHGEKELRSSYQQPEKDHRESTHSKSATFKTKTCNNFDRGVCHKKKEDCNYAHGKEDLRLPRHEEQAERNDRSSKNEGQNNPRMGTHSDKNERRNEERKSSSTGRQQKNEEEKARRNHATKNCSKPEKDINDKYTLSERDHSFPTEKVPLPQALRYQEEGSGDGSQVPAGYASAMGYYGHYFAQGMPFVQPQLQQSQMAQSQLMPGFQGQAPEGYPNYFVPMYHCYPPMQHQMNFYPPFANFVPQSGSAAYPAPRTSFDYLNGSSNAHEGAFAAGKTDKKQTGRPRPSRNEQEAGRY